jgi:hypothetical protein
MLSEIKDVKNRHRDFLMSLPNVVSLGVGPKMVKRVATGTTAIKVFVSRKVPLSDLAQDESVPEQIEGFQTDVEVMERLKAL